MGVERKLSNCRHAGLLSTSARRVDSLRGREPALLLFHLDLLRDADGVLCVGLGHGAAIHGLVLQRTHGCAEVEDMRL